MGGRTARRCWMAGTRVDAVLARFDDPRLRGETGATVEASVVHGVLQRDYGFLGVDEIGFRPLDRLEANLFFPWSRCVMSGARCC
jgi:hypothetical protein